MANEPVFLYDGDCAFCTACATAALRLRPAAKILPWQEVDLSTLGLTVHECETAVQWVDGDEHAAGPDAINRLFRVSRAAWGAWRLLGHLLRISPVRWFAWRVYNVIARNRHRIPWGSSSCQLGSNA